MPIISRLLLFVLLLITSLKLYINDCYNECWNDLLSDFTIFVLSLQGRNTYDIIINNINIVWKTFVSYIRLLLENNSNCWNPMLINI